MLAKPLYQNKLLVFAEAFIINRTTLGIGDISAPIAGIVFIVFESFCDVFCVGTQSFAVAFHMSL